MGGYSSRFCSHTLHITAKFTNFYPFQKIQAILALYEEHSEEKDDLERETILSSCKEAVSDTSLTLDMLDHIYDHCKSNASSSTHWTANEVSWPLSCLYVWNPLLSLIIARLRTPSTYPAFHRTKYPTRSHSCDSSSASRTHVTTILPVHQDDLASGPTSAACSPLAEPQRS